MMTMRPISIIAVLLLAGSAGGVAAQKILTVPRFELRLGYPTRGAGVDWGSVGTDAKLPSGGYLSLAADPRYGLHRHELSIAEGALKGAQIGTTVGMFIGALGNTFGAWDERTAWLMTGVLAATAGALGGAAVEYGDDWRYELRWDDDG